jgi:hypothetical protein
VSETYAQTVSGSIVSTQMMSGLNSLPRGKKRNASVVLRGFLELIDANAAQIRNKAELH